jgi:cell division protein FtsB
MRSRVLRHPFLRWLLRPLPLIMVAGTLCFVGWYVLGSGGVWDAYSLKQRYVRQQQQIAELKSRRDYLQQRLDDVKKKDELALEQSARDFGLVAPGETIYEIKVDSASK